MSVHVPGRKPLGRPTLCDERTKEIIFEAISNGNYLSTACQAAGISTDTYNNWQNRAAKGEEPYFSFIGEMKKAAAIDEAFRVSRIKKHGETNLIADLAHLGRRYRDRWAENRPDMAHEVQQIQVTVTFRPPLVVEGDATPLEIVEGEVRELGPGEEQQIGQGEGGT